MPDRSHLGPVLRHLDWMEQRRIWPNGLRYLWTDAFGVILLASLAETTSDDRFVERAKWVVSEVERVLGRARGIRIGQEADRDGQYYHYLAMWLLALHVLGRHDSGYRDRGLSLVREIHDAFVVPGVGVHWKMLEDLSGPYPNVGVGILDALHGYVVYRLLGERELRREIRDMASLIEDYHALTGVTQDLALGMVVWLTHFFPDEPWVRPLRQASLGTLDQLWIDPPGYFCRGPGQSNLKFAFTNYGVSVGLQSVGEWPERVARLNDYFATYRSNEEYDSSAITHVMRCSSLFPGRLLHDGSASPG